MHPVTETETLARGRDELEPLLVAGFLALFVESVAVVDLWRGVDCFVFVGVC